MKYKIVISGLLALSVIFQAAQPLSVFAQEASVDSQKAAKKKIPKKPTRIFSAMPSLEPETPEAKELAKVMQQSVRDRLTPITLGKFELKSVKPAPSVSADTKFTINELAADSSLALGYASVPGGDAFAVFLKQSNGVVGIVETYQRLVGNKKIDLEREAQLQAVGFKVHSLVDRYQVVHWNSLDPKGIPETVAKPPTFATKSMTPNQLHEVIFPKLKKATGASVAGVLSVPVGITAAAAAAALNAPNALRKYDTPKYDCWCQIKKGPYAKCPPTHRENECFYNGVDDKLNPISIGGYTKRFYTSEADCNIQTTNEIDKFCTLNCQGLKVSANSKEVKCRTFNESDTPIVETPTGEDLKIDCLDLPATFRFERADTYPARNPINCRFSGMMSCKPLPYELLNKVVQPSGPNPKVTCIIGKKASAESICPDSNNQNFCTYPPVRKERVYYFPDKRGDDWNQEAWTDEQCANLVENCHEFQQAEKSTIDCGD
jgi:hypothetical protein